MTVLANWIFLCTRCHRNVHDGFLFIEGTAPDGLTFRDREDVNSSVRQRGVESGILRI
ncbi:MAG: hypothetical protein AB7J86_18550 [Vulcanimicrobiota bacterium]